MAIAMATVVMMFSYFPYAAAFARPEETGTIDGGLVAVALAVAPFVFIVLAFVSKNPTAPRKVLQAMGLLLGFGLAVGLLSPVLGAATGLGAGAVLCLSPPDVPNVLKWRLAATALMVVYTFGLLVTITPSGVFSGGLLPLMMVGFADEYAVWAHRKRPIRT